MSDTEDKKTDDQGQDQGQQNQGDSKNNQDSDSTLKLPEKLQGKSPEEVTKMYLDLEKKLGEQSEDIEAARDLEKQLTPILNVIWADPELFKTIKARIAGDLPTDDKDKKGEDKPEGEDKKEVEVRTDPEVRKHLENTIVSDFETKYGLDKLPQDDRKGIWQKIFATVAELVDPGGSKTPSQVIDSINLSKLPKFLDNAYLLVNRSEEISKAKDQGAAQVINNQRGMMGTMPSSSAGNEEGISDAEKAVAEKMGISETEWKESKEKLEAQFK